MAFGGSIEGDRNGCQCLTPAAYDPGCKGNKTELPPPTHITEIQKSLVALLPNRQMNRHSLNSEPKSFQESYKRALRDVPLPRHYLRMARYFR